VGRERACPQRRGASGCRSTRRAAASPSRRAASRCSRASGMIILRTCGRVLRSRYRRRRGVVVVVSPRDSRCALSQAAAHYCVHVGGGSACFVLPRNPYCCPYPCPYCVSRKGASSAAAPDLPARGQGGTHHGRLDELAHGVRGLHEIRVVWHDVRERVEEGRREDHPQRPRLHLVKSPNIKTGQKSPGRRRGEATIGGAVGVMVVGGGDTGSRIFLNRSHTRLKGEDLHRPQITSRAPARSLEAQLETALARGCSLHHHQDA